MNTTPSTWEMTTYFEAAMEYAEERVLERSEYDSEEEYQRALAQDKALGEEYVYGIDALNHVYGYGKTREEALSDLRGSVEFLVLTMLIDGEPLPGFWTYRDGKWFVAHLRVRHFDNKGGRLVYPVDRPRISTIAGWERIPVRLREKSTKSS